MSLVFPPAHFGAPEHSDGRVAVFAREQIGVAEAADQNFDGRLDSGFVCSLEISISFGFGETDDIFQIPEMKINIKLTRSGQPQVAGTVGLEKAIKW